MLFLHSTSLRSSTFASVGMKENAARRRLLLHIFHSCTCYSFRTHTHRHTVREHARTIMKNQKYKKVLFISLVAATATTAAGLWQLALGNDDVHFRLFVVERIFAVDDGAMTVKDMRNSLLST